MFYVSATDYDGNQPFGAGYFPDDWYFGGDGNDTISYQQSTLKIVADLTSGIINRMEPGPLQGQYTVQSADMVYSIENLNGSNYDDVITGSDGANLLRGFGGNDTIDGEWWRRPDLGRQRQRHARWRRRQRHCRWRHRQRHHGVATATNHERRHDTLSGRRNDVRRQRRHGRRYR